MAGDDLGQAANSDARYSYTGECELSGQDAIERCVKMDTWAMCSGKIIERL